MGLWTVIIESSFLQKVMARTAVPGTTGASPHAIEQVVHCTTPKTTQIFLPLTHLHTLSMGPGLLEWTPGYWPAHQTPSLLTPSSLRSDYSSQASDPTPWSVLRLAFIHCPYVYWAGPCLALDMPLKRTASLQSRNRDTDTETKCMNTEEGK